jgi:F-type H+-transporting ATPase subunit delta
MSGNSPNTIAYPYANALFALAKSQNKLSQWQLVLSRLGLVALSPAFKQLTNNPQLEKSQVLECLLDGGDEELRRFLSLLIQGNRLNILAEIVGLFDKLVAKEQNTAKALIQSAFVMDDAEINSFEKLLSKKYGKQITAELEVVPNLIGGVKIIIDDVIIDASIKGSLNKMAAQLIQ